MKLENEIHTGFRKVADQVVHDIRSPLASLLMILKSCDKEIPEKTRVALREAAIGISDIANNLLCKYETNDTASDGDPREEQKQPIIVPLVLLQILSEKKHQYKELSIKFTHDFCKNCNYVFINIELSHFKRMISNLINNAVDAVVGKKGVVQVKLHVDNKRVKISIIDNGKGMSQRVRDKIMKNIAITDNKKHGHGIGFVQIQDTLQQNNGKLKINSVIGKGTEIVVTFPTVKTPKWLAQEIVLKQGDTIIILDDDTSIHGAWDTRFKKYGKAVCLKHFTMGEEAIKFIQSFPAKERMFLLTDFELLNQELNGLHVIEKTKIIRSILVTSHYTNLIVRNLAIKNGTKILPKQLASEIPIKIINTQDKKKAATKSMLDTKTNGKRPKKVNLVLIYDKPMIVESLVDLVKSYSKTIDAYSSPERFLEKVAQYKKGTKIFIDYTFVGGMNGIKLAKQLHVSGYSNLYLFSGRDFRKNEVPPYLTVISKTDTDKLLKFIK